MIVNDHIYCSYCNTRMGRGILVGERLCDDCLSLKLRAEKRTKELLSKDPELAESGICGNCGSIRLTFDYGGYLYNCRNCGYSWYFKPESLFKMIDLEVQAIQEVLGTKGDNDV